MTLRRDSDSQLLYTGSFPLDFLRDDEEVWSVGRGKVRIGNEKAGLEVKIGQVVVRGDDGKLRLSDESFPVCDRCQRPVVKERDRYHVFESMHWVCFHFEYEHEGDPDERCGDPDCPVRR